MVLVVFIASIGPASAGYPAQTVQTPTQTSDSWIGCIQATAFHTHTPNNQYETQVANTLTVWTAGKQSGDCSGSTWGYVDTEASFFWTDDPAAGPKYQCLSMGRNGGAWGFDYDVIATWSNDTCRSGYDGWYATASNHYLSDGFNQQALIGYGSWWIYQHKNSI